MAHSRVEHYRTLAQILGLPAPSTNLLDRITQPDYNWEPLVQLASAHLVLPTVYYQLQGWGLLHHLPEALANLIEQLATINHNRNKGLIKQAQAIATCLDAHHIPYVFLKGTALLLGGYYQKPGARMLGDIDLLVAPEQALEAYGLLQSCLGYRVLAQSVALKPTHHHLPRMVKKDNLAAVELHTAVGRTIQTELLQTSSILAHRRSVKGYSLPHNEVLLHHAVHHMLVNNLGSIGKLTPGFRTYCDVLAIMQQGTHLATCFESAPPLQVFASYHSLYDARFYAYRPLIRWLYKTRLHYAFFNRCWRFGWQTFIRLGLLINSSTYRTSVFKKLINKRI